MLYSRGALGGVSTIGADKSVVVLYRSSAQSLAAARSVNTGIGAGLRATPEGTAVVLAFTGSPQKSVAACT
jgi:hypothetical protein